jgi:uncharacterized protein YcbK (DUF882 family)
MTRRDALKRILWGGLTTSLLPFWSQISEASVPRQVCSGKLSLYNIHTAEALTVCYLDENRKFDPAALDRLNRLFRCHYNNRVHHIDPQLFLLLDTIRCRLGAHERPFELVSGYRSPEYNRLLCSKSSNVAKNSYHLKGMAADVRLQGVDLKAIQTTGISLESGGVGIYSEFVHLDVGPVRHW